MIIRPDAEADIAAACDWYEQQREGLGTAFLLRVEGTLESIRRMPEAHPVIHKTVRRALIPRFPFAI